MIKLFLLEFFWAMQKNSVKPSRTAPCEEKHCKQLPRLTRILPSRPFGDLQLKIRRRPSSVESSKKSMQQLIKQSTTALHAIPPPTNSSIHHYRMSFSPLPRALKEVAFTLSLSPLLLFHLSLPLYLLVLCGLEKLNSIRPRFPSLSISNSELKFMPLLSKRLRDNEQSNDSVLCGEHLNFASRRKVKSWLLREMQQRRFIFIFIIPHHHHQQQGESTFSQQLLLIVLTHMNICLSHVEQYNL